MVMVNIMVGFVAASLIATVLWSGNAAFSRSVMAGSHPADVVGLSEEADGLLSSKLPSTAVNDIVDAARGAGVTKSKIETLSVGGVIGGSCKASVNTLLIARQNVQDATSADGGIIRPGFAQVGSSLARACNIVSGQEIQIGPRMLKVIGVGDVADEPNGSDSVLISEADMSDLYRSASEANSVNLAFRSPIEAAQFIRKNKIEGVRILSSRKLLGQESRQFLLPTLVLTFELAGLMMCGALVALLLSLQTVIDRRSRELGVLTVLGFSRAQLAASVSLEVVLLSAAGALIGVLLVALIGLENPVSIMSPGSGGQVSVRLLPGPAVITGVVASCATLAGVASYIFANRYIARISVRLHGVTKL